MVLEIKGVYDLILFILVIGAVLDISDNYKLKERIFKVNILILFIFATMRYGVGSDYSQYETLYQNSHSLLNLRLNELIDNKYDLEIGYLLFQSLVKTFSSSYRFFLFIYNLLLFYFLYISINQWKNKNIQLLVFYSLFYLFYITSTYRQGMALVILYYNLKNLELKNYKKGIFFIILAGLFHKSSYIYILVYPFLRKKYTKKFYILFLFICLLIAYNDFFLNLLEVMNLKLNKFSFFRRVYYYYTVKNNGKIGASLLGYFQKILLLFFMIFNLKNTKKIYNNLMFFYLTSFILLSNVGILAGRISSLFGIVQIYYFSNTIYCYNKIKKMIFFILLIIFCTIYFQKELYTKNPIRKQYNYLPYKIKI